jgi:hypothetical protein
MLEFGEGRLWTRPSGVWDQGAPFAELGLPVVPVVLGAAALVYIGNETLAWLNSQEEDWSDNAQFKQRARELHTRLLRIQCVIGGAANADIKDSEGKVLCARGTKTGCSIPEGLKANWSDFLRGFSAMWKTAAERTFGPNAADAALLKSYVQRTYTFTQEFKKFCKDGTIDDTGAPVVPVEKSSVPWGLIVGGVAGVAAMVLLLRSPVAPIIVQTARGGR